MSFLGAVSCLSSLFPLPAVWNKPGITVIFVELMWNLSHSIKDPFILIPASQFSTCVSEETKGYCRCVALTKAFSTLNPRGIKFQTNTGMWIFVMVPTGNRARDFSVWGQLWVPVTVRID